MIQNFDGYRDAQTIETITYQQPGADAEGNPLKNDKGNPAQETLSTQTQTLPMGPVASQEAIKMLGTNGGGFFNANSAHPYENPTPLTNFLQMLAIFLIPAALCFAFGRMVGDMRQGWAVLAAMTVIFVVMAVIGIDRRADRQSGPRSRSASTRRPAHCNPAATWRARKRASASRPPAVRGGHHGGFLRRGQCDA